MNGVCKANSLPVPLSPSINTLADEGATCRIVSSNFMQCCRVSQNVLEAVPFIHLFPECTIFLLELAALHGARDQQTRLCQD